MKKTKKYLKTYNEALVKADEFGSLIQKPLKEVYKDKEHRELFKDFALTQVAEMAQTQMVLLKEVLTKLSKDEIEFEDAMKATQGIKDEFLKYIEEENITKLLSMEDVKRIWKNKCDYIKKMYSREETKQ